MKISILLLAFFSFINPSYTKKPNTLSSGQKIKIRNSLQDLIKRDNSDAFVIITETTTDRFLQFAINNNQLLFDLPSGQLTPGELSKTKTILKEFNIPYTIQKAYDPNDATKVIGEFGGFSKEIGDDIDLALNITEKLITKVFNTKNKIAIKIDEN